jgi:hypothetical protein
MNGVTIQDATVHTDMDEDDGADGQPVHGDEQSEFKFVLDVTIWFVER